MFENSGLDITRFEFRRVSPQGQTTRRILTEKFKLTSDAAEIIEDDCSEYYRGTSLYAALKLHRLLLTLQFLLHRVDETRNRSFRINLN